SALPSCGCERFVQRRQPVYLGIERQHGFLQRKAQPLELGDLFTQLAQLRELENLAHQPPSRSTRSANSSGLIPWMTVPSRMLTRAARSRSHSRTSASFCFSSVSVWRRGSNSSSGF